MPRNASRFAWPADYGSDTRIIILDEITKSVARVQKMLKFGTTGEEPAGGSALTLRQPP